MATAPLSKKPPRPLIPTRPGVQFTSSGAFMLDLALGGGWARGRIINLVGDQSTGKTLLAMEALANFVRSHPTAGARYVEAEGAFDEEFADMIGMPKEVDPVDDIMTVEALFTDLDKFIADNESGFYVVDSLDALSDTAELERGIDEGSFGTQKARKLSELFRRLAKRLNSTKITVLIISQVRDKIGVTYGDRKTRSGGKALDFYSSQIVWLNEVEKLTRTVMNVKRTTGIVTRARVRKNKVGLPHREAKIIVRFGYGIDDALSTLEWLEEAKVKGVGVASFKTDITEAFNKADRAGLQDIGEELQRIALKHWNAVETEIAPTMRKYEDG